jgi:hypothetical protein
METASLFIMARLPYSKHGFGDTIQYAAVRSSGHREQLDSDAGR